MCGGQKQGLWVGMRGNERLWVGVSVCVVGGLCGRKLNGRIKCTVGEVHGGDV